jgi:hypothetical protein
VVTTIALVIWFWPTKLEAMALREFPTEPRDNELWLAVNGPRSNGWWGTMVFLAVLATALATFLAGYFYLVPDSHANPNRPLGIGWRAIAAAILAPAGAAAALLAARRGRTGAATRRFALAAAWIIQIALLWLTIGDYAGRGYEAAHSAYGSAVLGLYVFQWTVTVVLVAIGVHAQLWAWLRPADPRGVAPAENAASITLFAAACWLLVLGTIHIDPLLRWGGSAW